LEFGPLDVETILVERVQKREEAVSAQGTQDHTDLLLFDLLLSRRPAVDDRLNSILARHRGRLNSILAGQRGRLNSVLAGQRGRLTRSLVDVEWVRPVTGLRDLGNLEDWLDRGQARSLRNLNIRLGRSQGSLEDLKSRLHRGQARSLRGLKIRLGRSQRSLKNVKSRLDRIQARSLRDLKSRQLRDQAR
jgi:hypothetical protein